MIRGRRIGAPAGVLRPFVLAHVVIPALAIAGDVNFLVDTGADGTLLAAADAARLEIATSRLPKGTASRGVGGATPTVHTEATITLGPDRYQLELRILAPETARQRRELAHVPSLLGRDILSRFALFYDHVVGLVLLLEPDEAAAIRPHLP